jgi:hypothetical protein
MHLSELTLDERACPVSIPCRDRLGCLPAALKRAGENSFEMVWGEPAAQPLGLPPPSGTERLI